ncbi:hypothetical protein SAMN05443572_1182 [Myxococcus fulvus]|uniref:Lipoprotein n=1 Tax=Myxococcus fulvus TaxID=33 RepID=A0ABY1CXM2_MYXFU|nr:hypothetical protein SAMN05443572_1182 [Myxococcus fulvus]
MIAAIHTGAGRPSRTSTHGAAMNSLSEQCDQERGKWASAYFWRP